MTDDAHWLAHVEGGRRPRVLAGAVARHGYVEPDRAPIPA